MGTRDFFLVFLVSFLVSNCSVSDPDADSESGSGSRRAKMTHINRKKGISYFEVLDGLF